MAGVSGLEKEILPVHVGIEETQNTRSLVLSSQRNPAKCPVG